MGIAGNLVRSVRGFDDGKIKRLFQSATTLVGVAFFGVLFSDGK